MGTVTPLAEAVPLATFTSPWLTQREAAAFSRRSIRMVNEALRAGALRGYQTKPGGNGKRGGAWSIHVDDLNDWIRAGSPIAGISRQR